MSFWHFTLRIRKKQYRLWVVKVKFHVFTRYKNMKSGLCSFYSVSLSHVTIARPHYALAQTLVPVKCSFFCQQWLSDADRVNWLDVIFELRTEQLNTPYFAITQSVVSKQHHSLKCRKIRLCNRPIFWNAYVISNDVFVQHDEPRLNGSSNIR